MTKRVTIVCTHVTEGLNCCRTFWLLDVDRCGNKVVVGNNIRNYVPVYHCVACVGTVTYRGMADCGVTQVGLSTIWCSLFMLIIVLNLLPLVNRLSLRSPSIYKQLFFRHILRKVLFM